jgi:hypothetical protein
MIEEISDLMQFYEKNKLLSGSILVAQDDITGDWGGDKHVACQ